MLRSVNFCVLLHHYINTQPDRVKNLSSKEFLLLVQKPAAGFFKRALVIQEIMADRFTPVSLFESLSQEFKGGTILESGLQEKQTGRFSFLAFESFAGLELLNKALRQYVGEKEEFFDCDPVVQLRRPLHDLDCACPVELRESITQSIGFMGYDAVRLFEEIPDRHARDKMLRRFKSEVQHSALKS